MKEFVSPLYGGFIINSMTFITESLQSSLDVAAMAAQFLSVPKKMPQF